jgi:N-acetylglucosamine-6-phosphate deacetylase
MTAKAISGARILSGGRWFDDRALIFKDGRIVSIVPADELAETIPIERLTGGFLLPGFIDTQVNGGGGILFNDHPTVDGIAAIAAAHRSFCLLYTSPSPRDA